MEFLSDELAEFRETCFRLIDDGAMDERDDRETFRLPSSESLVMCLFISRLEWIVMADVAAVQQWHRLKTFIVAAAGGGGGGGRVFIVSNSEQRGQSFGECRYNGWYW
jgi:hypothetical protein